MRKLFFKTFSLAFAFTMFFPISLSAYQENLSEDEIDRVTSSVVINGGSLLEFKDLVSKLITENQAVHATGFAFEEAPLIPVNDERFTALRELNKFINEASTVQSKVRGIDKPDIIISMFAEPNEHRDTFFIAFTNEDYFELVDFIVDFTGIAREEMEITVEEYGFFWPVGLPTEIYELDEDDVDISPRNVTRVLTIIPRQGIDVSFIKVICKKNIKIKARPIGY